LAGRYRFDVDAMPDDVVLTSEFASVRLAIDRSANGVRLFVEDVEANQHIFLDPLELASLCHASPEDRVGWLRVGPYLSEGDDRGAAP
jgi:hypothetical protein